MLTIAFTSPSPTRSLPSLHFQNGDSAKGECTHLPNVILLILSLLLLLLLLLFLFIVGLAALDVNVLIINLSLPRTCSRSGCHHRSLAVPSRRDFPSVQNQEKPSQRAPSWQMVAEFLPPQGSLWALRVPPSSSGALGRPKGVPGHPGPPTWPFDVPNGRFPL